MPVPRLSRTLLLACALFAALASSPPPQNSAARQLPAEPPRTLYVSVYTDQGELAGGLAPAAFGVYDGEALVRVVSFERGDVPTTVGLLLDASSSMRMSGRPNLFASMRGGLQTLFWASKSADDFFLVAFNQKPQLLLRDTSDPAEVLAAFDRLTAARTRGQTAFYDALYLGLNHAANGRHARRVLVVVSDCRESGVSKFGPGEVKRAVREGDVILYVVRFDPNGFDDQNADSLLMNELAAMSGGRVYRPLNEKELEDSLRRIAAELRTQYAITVAPAPSLRKDGWHEIKLKMAAGRTPDGKLHKLHARTRKGFYWPARGN